MNLRSKKCQRISGWGNFPVVSSDLYRPEKISQLSFVQGHQIARGLGRSYGDAALNSGKAVVSMERLNRFIDFDEQSGLLQAEAGVTIEEVLHTFVPRGWFVPVTPGTQHVTLGGCLACDVHGKNHHCDGVFSDHVREFTITLANGKRLVCDPVDQPELFWATAGGMGLTGIITDISLKLIPIETAYMVVKNTATEDLESTLEILKDPEHDDRYSVAWIDCLAVGKKAGRGIVMNGHHASINELPGDIKHPLGLLQRRAREIPATIPSLLLNPMTVSTFNRIYYMLNSRKGEAFIQDCLSYFYPLDAIANWNYFYGKKGFIQYQFVIPANHATSIISRILETFAHNRMAPYLAVLKRFGEEGKGMLSFPKKGFTLALDVPVKSGLKKVIASVDEIVLEKGGRVYLAKDAFLNPETFRAMYPRYSQWWKIKQQADPKGVFTSDLSRRLKMDEGI